MNEQALEVLRAEREITRVILRYARGIDGLDFELVRSCFHPDAEIEYGDFFRGSLDETIAFLQDSLPRLEGTLHTFSPPWIELDLERGTATCETRSINSARYPPDAAGVSLQNVTGTRYYDRFERREGAWRLVWRRNEREWFQNRPDIPEPPPPTGGSRPVEGAVSDSFDPGEQALEVPRPPVLEADAIADAVAYWLYPEEDGWEYWTLVPESPRVALSGNALRLAFELEDESFELALVRRGAAWFARYDGGDDPGQELPARAYRGEDELLFHFDHLDESVFVRVELETG